MKTSKSFIHVLFCLGFGAAGAQAQGWNLAWDLNPEPEVREVEDARMPEVMARVLSETPHRGPLPRSIRDPRYYDDYEPLRDSRTANAHDAETHSIGADDLIRLGQAFWNFIQSNQATVTTKTESMSVVPKEATYWNEFDGWKTPTSKVFVVTYRNVMGWKVIEFSYRIVYTYGGSYKGHGAYLTRVAVVPQNIQAFLTFSVDAQATVPGIVNVGTTEEPVAGAEILVEWTARSLVNVYHQSRSYFVTGAGRLEKF